ncbi:MAG: MFS transporter [Dactylosporangium sp.]|nr:MFS transporter [Dactylosporangium sp.]NNJ61079.1 MFS transporter [Dactylosporangium sp.]
MSSHPGCRRSPVADGDRVPGRRHNLVTVLRQRGFRRLLAGRLAAQLADGLFQAGLAGSVLFNPEQAASPLAIAAAFAVILLPYSLIGPYLGVFLDRWSRRTVIVLANLLRAVLAIPVIALIWTGAQGIPFLFMTLLVIGLGRLFLAAVSAALPHVVEDRQLVTANAFANTLGSIVFSAGLGGVALLVLLGLPATFHGYASVAVLAPLGYALSAAVTRWSYNPTELGPDVRHRHSTTLRGAVAEVGRQTANGFRHLARRPPALYPLAAQSVHRVFYGVLALAVTLRYRYAFAEDGDLGGSVSGIGGAFVTGGIGILVAALITPAIARRIGGRRWITLLLAVTGVVVATFGLPASSTLLPIAVGWVALASQGTKIVVDTALQHECADEYRGRAFSINDTLFNLCFVVGTYAGALAMPDTGRAPAVMTAVALGYAAVTVWFAVVSGRVSRAARAVIPAARETLRPCMPAAPHESRWASAR